MRRDIFKVAVVFFVSSFLIQLDPFGFEEATFKAAKNIIYNVYGAIYPRDYQDKTAVVLVDNTDLSTFEEKWPPSYGMHARILSQLKSFNPKAVMVDLVFYSSRPDPSLNALLQVIAEYHADGIPLYFAVARPQLGIEVPVRPEIAALAEAGQLNLVSIAIEEPLGEPTIQPVLPDDRGYSPASVTIYRDLCRSKWLESCPQDTIDLTEKMETLWGAKPTSFGCYGREDDCNRISSSAIYRFIQIVLNNICGNIPCTNEWLQVGLPYSNSVFASELGREANKVEFSTLFSDVAVFYGADWALVQDKIFSPVHGEWLAGIYHHAMAFDNLVTFGEDYVRPDLPYSMPAIVHDELVLALFCVVLLFVRWLFRYFELSETHRAYRLSVGFGLSFFLPLLVAVFEFAVLSLSPTNWLGLFGVLTFGLILSTEELQTKAGAVAAGAAARSRRLKDRVVSNQREKP